MHTDNLRHYTGSILSILLNGWGAVTLQVLPVIAGLIVSVFTVLHFWESIKLRRLEQRKIQQELNENKNEIQP